MHRFLVAAAIVAALAFAGTGVLRADSPASACGGTPQTGAVLIVVCGDTPCPPGYVDPVGSVMRNLGISGENIMVSQSQQRWLCQMSDPVTAPSPASSDTADTSTSDASASPPVAVAPPPLTTSIGVSSSATAGSYLTTPQRMTLYTRAGDTAGVSNCTGTCAIIWLPFQPPSSSLTLPDDATGTLAVINRADGTQQVTYNGIPLYTYTGDLQPGDTNGQGIGGVYQVATP